MAAGLGPLSATESAIDLLLRDPINPRSIAFALHKLAIDIPTFDPEPGGPTQQALEGIVRSVGKEMRAGGTANMVYVAEGADANAEATVRFFLSGRSAYVSAQVVHVGEAVGEQRRHLVRGRGDPERNSSREVVSPPSRYSCAAMRPALFAASVAFCASRSAWDCNVSARMDASKYSCWAV